MYKLVKLMRLVRILKTLKSNKKSGMMKQAKEALSLGAGFERMMMFIMISFMVCHITACLWVFTATFSDNFKGTWVEAYGAMNKPVSQKYLTSLYFTVTTITTVGYGDISAKNPLE